MKQTYTIGWQCADAFATFLLKHPELNANGRNLHVLKGLAITYKNYEAFHPFMFNGNLYVD